MTYYIHNGRPGLYLEIDMKRPGTEIYPKTVGPWELEPYYSRHVGAMTAEGLHDKADIAFQLALRDKRIAELEAWQTEVRITRTVHNPPPGDTLHAAIAIADAGAPQPAAPRSVEQKPQGQ